MPAQRLAEGGFLASTSPNSASLTTWRERADPALALDGWLEFGHRYFASCLWRLGIIFLSIKDHGRFVSASDQKGKT